MRKTLIALCAVAILGFVQSQRVYDGDNTTTSTTSTTPAPPAPVPVPVPVRKANNITVKFDEEAAKNASNSIFRVFKSLSEEAEYVVKNGFDGVYTGIRTAFKNA